MKILIMQGDSLNPPSFIRNLIQELLLQGVNVGLIGKRKENRFKPEHGTGKFQVMYYPITNMAEQIAVFFFFLVVRPRTLFTAMRIIRPTNPWKLYIKKTILCAKLMQYKPDAIHVQWANHLTDFDDILRAGIFKFIVSLRGRHINVVPLTDPDVAAFYRSLFPLVSGFHAVSQAIAREAERYGAAANKIRVIRSVINQSFLSAFEETKNPVRAPLSILSVGRFHWKKGYADALRAMHALKGRGVKFRYTIIAGNEIPEEILFLVHQLDLKKEVVFIDKIRHDKVPGLMKENSVLLLPSLEEGIANVVLEAMAVGLPVVSTRSGGMNEVVINSQTGWLVPVADAKAMADALEDYLGIPDAALLTIRKNAFDLVRMHNQGSVQADKFKSFYNDVIQGLETIAC